MSILSKLFGSRSAAKAEANAQEYNGFTIFAEPASEAGGYRIAARIEKEINDELKVHMMIRADTYSSLDTANEASMTKAQQLIDQQGDRIFR